MNRTTEIDLLIKKLAQPADENKPWMTASALAGKIKPLESNADEVTKCLYDYYKTCKHNNETPVIRYSSLPSKKTLELLWAHTQFVGSRMLTGINKTDQADDGLSIDTKEADVFISHSFKDYDQVIEIAKMLQQHGIKPWLAETHIGEGNQINQSVIEALNNATCFIFFLSANSLKSKWSSKELSYAHQKRIKVMIIADCGSEPILSLVQNKFENTVLPPGTAEIFRNGSLQWIHTTDITIYPQVVGETVKPANTSYKIFTFNNDHL